MAVFRDLKNNLTGGQISPTASRRMDLAAVKNGADLMLNAIPRLSGGAYRRPGTFHESSVSQATNHAPRLFPFVVSKSESYAIQISKTIGGNAYAKYFRPTSNSSTSSSGSVTGTPPWSFPTLTTMAADETTDDQMHEVQYVQSVDVMTMVHPLHKPRRLFRTAANTFKFGTFDQYNAAGTITTFAGADLMNAWPYLDQNVSAITLAISAATVGTGRTLTASAAFFNTAHVGAFFKVNVSGTVGCAEITAFTSSTSVTATVHVAFGGTSASAAWWESAWSDYRGWPRSVILYQNRIGYAGTKHMPDSIWWSKAYNFDVMSIIGMLQDSSPGDGVTTGPTGPNPFRIGLLSSQISRINWMINENQLVIGTADDEWFVDTVDGSFGANARFVKRQSGYGSDYMMAQKVGTEIIFATKTLREVRSYQYNFVQSRYYAEPVQLLFDQYPKTEYGLITAGRKKYRTIQWDETRKTLWCVDTAGNWFGMTRDQQLGITAWHTHKLGGTDTSQGDDIIGTGADRTTDPAYGYTDGGVNSLILLPNPVIGTLDVWMIVKRTIEDVVHWFTERMIGDDIPIETVHGTSALYDGNSPSRGGPYMMDAAQNLLDAGVPTDLAYSLGTDFAAATVVSVYYSEEYGVFKGSGTVAAATGIYTYARKPAYDYGTLGGISTIGFHFDTIIDPTRIEAGSVIGTAQGAVKRVSECTVQFFRTMYAKVGMIGDEQLSSPEIVEFKPASLGLAYSPELFSGDKRITMPSTYDREGQMRIQQTEPLPFEVTAIVAEGETFD
jgi:hypothetical protein